MDNPRAPSTVAREGPAASPLPTPQPHPKRSKTMICNLQTGEDAKEDPGKEGGRSVFERDLCWRLMSLEDGGAIQQEEACQATSLWPCWVAISSESEHLLLEGGVLRPLARVR